jgi:hypothetical protein
MESFKYGRHTVNIPQNWNELTTRQLLTLAMLSNKGLSIQSVKLLFAFHVLGACVLRCKDDTTYILVRRGKRFTLTLSECALLSSKFDWVFTEVRDEEGEVSLQLQPKFVNSPFDRIGRLKGPGDFFDRLTYYQYMFLMFYESILDEDPDNVNRLLACLWHSGKEFDDARIERDRRRIARTSSAKRTVMLWYYIGCKEALHKRFPRIFGGDGSGSSGNVFEDQMRVVDALAGGDMTKKDLVRKGYLYDALISMDESIRRNEEMEEAMNKHK